jgi:hypothetical protein
VSARRFLCIAAGVCTALAAPAACGAGEARVMFVSKQGDREPALVDPAGKRIPARKGAVILSGYSLVVPEGATVQVMTAEKGIVAVRPNSLVSFDEIGGAKTYKLTLNRGGLRVAHPESNPKPFEVSTPNALVKLDQGDHEAYFLLPGKLEDGSWGTFVRGIKEPAAELSTAGGTLKLAGRDIGHVRGTGRDKPVLYELKVDAGGKPLGNPVIYLPGAREIGTSEMTRNFAAMNEPGAGPAEPGIGAQGTAGPSARGFRPVDPGPAPIGAFAALKDPGPVSPFDAAKLTPSAGLARLPGGEGLPKPAANVIAPPPKIHQILLDRTPDGTLRPVQMDPRGTQFNLGQTLEQTRKRDLPLVTPPGAKPKVTRP